MIPYIFQRSAAYVAVSLALLHAPLSANKQCCKTLGSLAVKCALNVGSLSVTNNVTIGGNVTVNGTVSSTSGSFGDLLAYGNWVFLSTATLDIAAGNSIPFNTDDASLNITLDPVTESIFTVNLAGTYLIMYQVSGNAPNLATSFTLKRSTGGGAFNPLVGGTIDFPFDGDSRGEVANMLIVTGVVAGDQFQLFNGPQTIALDAANGGNGAAITFLRIHG